MKTQGPVNRVVFERILNHIETRGSLPASEAVTEPESDSVHEYGDCRYLLQTIPTASPGQLPKLRLSFAFPELPAHFSEVIMNSTALDTIRRMYSGVAKITDTEPGYQVSLDIDVRFLARLSKPDRDMAVKNLASIRIAVVGAPLREHFMRLSRGEGVDCNVESHWNRPGQVYFVKPEVDSVVVLFPIRFVSTLDSAIGTSFLTDFVEARSMASLGLAPACNYFAPEAGALPNELEGVELGHSTTDGEVNGGFMRFAFLRRHVDGPQLEHVLWSLSSFYYTISYHIKGAKALMHSHMRSKIAAMHDQLHGKNRSVGYV